MKGVTHVQHGPESIRSFAQLASQSMNIFHIITGTNVGGAEIVLERTLSAIDRTRFENSVLSLLPSGPIAEKISQHGPSVSSLDMARGYPGPSQLLRFIKTVRSSRPDLIHGWMYHGSLAATVAWRLKGKKSPLIWSIHHSLNKIEQEPPMTQRIVRQLARWSGRPAAIIYCSKTSQRQHEAVGFERERAVFIPNGIDTTSFQPDAGARGRLQSLLGVDQNRTLVAVIGRVDPMKDHANAIRAAGRVIARGKSIQLILIGRDADSDNDALMDLINAEKMQDNITLLGQRNDIQSLMPGLDILMSSSAWGEAFPLVVAEAMATGVPVVATDLGDTKFLIDDTGFVVPPRDPDALASAIETIVDMDPNERRALGAKARERISTNFALDSVTRMYEDVYARVAAEA